MTYTTEQLNKLYDNINSKYRFFQIKDEFIHFLSLAQKTKPKLIHTIGFACGSTDLAFSYLADEIITIDCCQPKDRTVLSKIRKNCKHTFITSFSQKPRCVDRFKRELNGRKVDLLFIDGDHSYDGVKQDFNIYSQFVRPGGIIGLHDIRDTSYHRELGCYVSKFWKEIKDNHDHLEILDCDPKDKVRGSKWGGIGIIYTK